jgi:hypothetical protein
MRKRSTRWNESIKQESKPNLGAQLQWLTRNLGNKKELNKQWESKERGLGISFRKNNLRQQTPRKEM